MADDRKFKFVSPGIFVQEIDNSQPPGLPEAIGPVIIGRFPKGPALRPIPVSTFGEFVEQFGTPVPGKQGGDIWRDGNTLGPTYASYAAQAWLSSTPRAQVVRLLGRAHDDGGSGQPSEAGWKVGNDIHTAWSSGSAYGMFIFQSGSDVKATQTSGTLAAVFYLKRGTVELSGNVQSHGDDNTSRSGSALMVKNVAEGYAYRVLIKDHDGTLMEDAICGFDADNKRYIRDRLNTNPTLLNSAVSTDQKTYFLGQTFERNVIDVVGSSSAANSHQACILGLRVSGANNANLASNLPFASNLRNTQPARSGWFIGQDLTTNAAGFAAATQQKLFRLEGLDDGEWCQNNIKISIEDIKASTNKSNPYGTFSLNIRKLDDKDGAPQYIERYSSLTLNPNSENYIAKRLGDQFYEWTESERRWVLKGNYPNISRYVRVRMNADVDDGTTDAKYLPFGFIGAPRLKGFKLDTNSAQLLLRNMSGSDPSGILSVVGKDEIARARGTQDVFVSGATQSENAHNYVGLFPKHPMTTTSKDGSLSDPTKTFFGLDVTRLKATDASITKQFEASVKDASRCMPAGGSDIVYSYAPNGVDGTADSALSALQPTSEDTKCLAKAKGNAAEDPLAEGRADQSDVFTLDDLVKDGVHATWTQGSRFAQTSVTAVTGAYTDILDLGFNKFTAPMFGGFDGLDILEIEPFRNSATKRTVSAAGGGTSDINAPLDGRTELTGYAFNSIKMAIDSVSDPDVVDANAVVAPGITNEDLTDHMLEVAEGRADMLAIMDLKGGYVPTSEGTAEVMGTVTSTVNNLKARDINSSYACAYYPWVQIQDTVNNARLWVPPSVVALGVHSSTDQKSELWFAPAGFTRGGLSENGAAGIPVLGVRERLNSKDRDKLYEACINPIAQFPAEGIVIFGQKTLQVTPSALDRINVRRLMIFLKREISKIAATTLFDQNVQATWDRFKGPAEILLSSVKGRFGLSAYKLILDPSTTTADLIDRNIMYAKILLAPTKAIEFIALDFVITRNGAAFED